MKPYHVRPTHIDRIVARQVAAHSGLLTEETANRLTWAADEHVLVAGAVGAWVLATVGKSKLQPAATHLLLAMIASAAAPHLLKRYVDQTRPDRTTAFGHIRGIPISGKAHDAFPSGHALHMGALASMATALPVRYRNAVWAVTGSLSATRVVLMAHWLSDVVVGFALGIAIERGIRRVTDYPDPAVEQMTRSGQRHE